MEELINNFRKFGIWPDSKFYNSCESHIVMTRLNECISDIEASQWQTEQKQREQWRAPDYSWLFNQSFMLSNDEKDMLERLCGEMKPCDVAHALDKFNKWVAKCTPPVGDLARIMCTAIYQTTQERRKQKSESKRKKVALSEISTKIHPWPLIPKENDTGPKTFTTVNFTVG